MGMQLRYILYILIEDSELVIINFLYCFFFFLQIQFKEKVLWTAITLFIFLVCCQVRHIVSLFQLSVCVCIN